MRRVPERARRVFDPLITREINVLRGLLGFEKYLWRSTLSNLNGVVQTFCQVAMFCKWSRDTQAGLLRGPFTCLSSLG